MYKFLTQLLGRPLRTDGSRITLRTSSHHALGQARLARPRSPREDANIREFPRLVVRTTSAALPFFFFFALQGVSVVSCPFTVLCHLRDQETGKENSRL